MSFEPIYKSLGKFLPEEGFCNCGKNKRNQCELCQSLIKGSALEQLVRVTASPDPEELRAAYQRIEELTAALRHAQEAIFWYAADGFESYPEGRPVGEVIAEVLS